VTIEHATLPGSAHDQVHDMVVSSWRAIGVAATTKAVTRAQYQEDVYDGDVEVGFWSWDRTSANLADSGRWLGTIADGPWAPKYGHWYAQLPGPREEPPPDHPIREVWRLWDGLQVKPDEARRQALFGEIVALHRQAPVAIGTVGEKVAPVIVANNFGNVPDGLLADDTLRDEGLANPQQFYFSA
jgi:peptide/nickel transport system substrate-binding protein